MATALKLKEGLSYLLRDGAVILQDATGNLLILDDLSLQTKSIVCEMINTPRVVHEGEGAFQVLQILHSHGFAYSPPNPPLPQNRRTAEWVENVVGDFATASEVLAGRKVAVLGVGGLGSVVAQQLCQSGVINLFLADYARLNEEDLNRQVVFTHRDVGRFKVNALASRLRRAHPQAMISVSRRCLEGRPAEITALVRRGICLAFICVDEPQGVAAAIIRGAVGTNLALLHAGVGLLDGSVSPLLIDDAARQAAAAVAEKGPAPLKSSLAMTNATVASIMAYRGFRFLIDPLYRAPEEVVVTFS